MGDPANQVTENPVEVLPVNENKARLGPPASNNTPTTTPDQSVRALEDTKNGKPRPVQ
jgi:hypothetical protein